MGKTKTQDSTPDQFGTCDAITGLATTNFKFADGRHFCIDNENETAVILSVKFINGSYFISKKIYPGTNPFLIKEIEANVLLTVEELANLKYGY